MDPNAAKLLYLCWKGGPHPAHEHFVTANADVVAVRPFNVEMVKYLAGKYDVAVADGFGTLPIGWALKKIGLISNLIFVTASNAFVDHRQIFKLMLKDVDGVIATSSLMRSLRALVLIKICKFSQIFQANFMKIEKEHSVSC
jgi:hypothetical protein